MPKVKKSHQTDEDASVNSEPVPPKRSRRIAAQQESGALAPDYSEAQFEQFETSKRKITKTPMDKFLGRNIATLKSPARKPPAKGFSYLIVH